MRRTPRPALVLALVALTGSPLAVSAASPITSSTEAWASQNAEAKRPSNEWMAWKLGREYAFAQTWQMLKKSAESEKSLGFARTFAKALGISEPPPPTADYLKQARGVGEGSRREVRRESELSPPRRHSRDRRVGRRRDRHRRKDTGRQPRDLSGKIRDPAERLEHAAEGHSGESHLARSEETRRGDRRALETLTTRSARRPSLWPSRLSQTPAPGGPDAAAR